MMFSVSPRSDASERGLFHSQQIQNDRFGFVENAAVVIFPRMRYGDRMIEVVTRSGAETKKIARILAREISAPDRVGTRGAHVLALSGELGAGKTTFAQGFAQALGVAERVLSPTFVLMKIYGLPKKIKDKSKKIKNRRWIFKHLIHIDCYRLASPKDLLHLGFKAILKDKDAIILIEWPERIKKILPPDALWLQFIHGARQNERRIKMSGSRGGVSWGGLTPKPSSR